MDLYLVVQISKGGVAVSYHDKSKNFGAIKIFTPYSELNAILQKVINEVDFKNFSDIIVRFLRMRNPKMGKNILGC